MYPTPTDALTVAPLTCRQGLGRYDGHQLTFVFRPHIRHTTYTCPLCSCRRWWVRLLQSRQCRSIPISSPGSDTCLCEPFPGSGCDGGGDASRDARPLGCAAVCLPIRASSQTRLSLLAVGRIRTCAWPRYPLYPLSYHYHTGAQSGYLPNETQDFACLPLPHRPLYPFAQGRGCRSRPWVPKGGKNGCTRKEEKGTPGEVGTKYHIQGMSRVFLHHLHTD